MARHTACRWSNPVNHLREEDRQAVEARLAAAYALRSTEEAQQALEQLHRELQELNPSAARSLEERLDETLTVNRLPLEGWLRRTLSTTNPRWAPVTGGNIFFFNSF